MPTYPSKQAPQVFAVALHARLLSALQLVEVQSILFTYFVAAAIVCMTALLSTRAKPLSTKLLTNALSDAPVVANEVTRTWYVD